MSEIIHRAVLTMATGEALYLRMAVNLARSFLLWHQDSDIRFFLATDQTDRLPADLAGVSVISLRPGQYGTVFSTKLHLDKIAPAEKTLFIDADCLCIGALDGVFEKFSGHAVSVVGSMASRGHWFGGLPERCVAFSVSAVPVFVGALYYLERGEVCSQVFHCARQAEREYDRGGFIRLRRQPNEEPLVSVGMACFGQTPIPEDGTIKADAMMWSHVRCNVLKGMAEVVISDSKHDWVRGFDRSEQQDKHTTSPRILHFNDRFATIPPYTSEVLALRIFRQMHLPPFICRTISALLRRFPYWLETKLKDAFRPIFRKIYGARVVRSAR